LTANKVDKFEVVSQLKHLMGKEHLSFDNPFDTAEVNANSMQVWFVKYNKDGSKCAVMGLIGGADALNMFIERSAYPLVVKSAKQQFGSVEHAIKKSKKEVA